jgi:hypothetical protein
MAARRCGKDVFLKWWGAVQVEDRPENVDSSDVLRPTALPDDDLTRSYVASLRRQPVFRKAGQCGRNHFFWPEASRSLLEQELLKAGAYIRTIAPNLNAYQRPLGNMTWPTLGFGCLHVTFRNCPNNAPLAFWVDSPWYPLFPRKTNR